MASATCHGSDWVGDYYCACLDVEQPIWCAAVSLLQGLRIKLSSYVFTRDRMGDFCGAMFYKCWWPFTDMCVGLRPCRCVSVLVIVGY